MCLSQVSHINIRKREGEPFSLNMQSTLDCLKNQNCFDPLTDYKFLKIIPSIPLTTDSERHTLDFCKNEDLYLISNILHTF